MEAKYVDYVCRLPIQMANQVKAHSKEINKKESEIIEAIVAQFLEEKIKKEIADTFRILKDDPEQEFLAEARLGDSLKMLDDYESE